MFAAQGSFKIRVCLAGWDGCCHGHQRPDYPIVQAVLLVMVLFFVLINLLTDLLYGMVDPRVREARSC